MTETEAAARASLEKCAAAATAFHHLLHGIAASVPPSPHESGPHDIPEPADFATELHGDLASMTGELDAPTGRPAAMVIGFEPSPGTGRRRPAPARLEPASALWPPLSP